MKTAIEILLDEMNKLTELKGITYPSFPAFVENESSVDVFDIVLNAMEKYKNQSKGRKTHFIM
jgi:hypothetical protein